MLKVCPNCGQEFETRDGRQECCSKHCSISLSHKRRKESGKPHHWSKESGYDHKAHNEDMVKKGIHPFLKQNFSEETRVENGHKISDARHKEAEEHKHIWQQRETRIRNEYSREMNIYSKKGINSLQLYMSEVPDLNNVIKIGVTIDINMRGNDQRFPILNPIVIKSGDLSILELERDIKLKFSSNETFNKYKSYEIYPIELKEEILKFINN